MPAGSSCDRVAGWVDGDAPSCGAEEGCAALGVDTGAEAEWAVGLPVCGFAVELETPELALGIDGIVPALAAAGTLVEFA